jgi:hypothetical protein
MVLSLRGILNAQEAHGVPRNPSKFRRRLLGVPGVLTGVAGHKDEVIGTWCADDLGAKGIRQTGYCCSHWEVRLRPNELQAQANALEAIPPIACPPSRVKDKRPHDEHDPDHRNDHAVSTSRRRASRRRKDA